MYLCDNGMQMTTAIEDFEYTKWLDPEGVPCYVKEHATIAQRQLQTLSKRKVGSSILSGGISINNLTSHVTNGTTNH